MAELERQDGTLVQGLNRMRQLRVQLDPTIEPYLVLSPYDDAVSLLASYGDNNPRLHTLWILETLIGAIVALIAAFLAAILAVILNVTGGTAFAVGVVTFLATAGLLAFVGVRSFASAMRSVKSVFPAPRAAEPDRSDHRESPP